ncbi:3D-(3,5/4)-trihydroxycyclohexane-1,2-dione hydrolase [Asanoa ferruginea]|uniref:3D-(3,5/4)-trihydroxycyclohexane-1,2-dione hydrolase n=1 Tax=Asanoa ferruginea TaxID=53367 RepID=A0A3D9ZS19_9ACTN|nr:3D-(3,5/4)-trihydroxycyclohexane-1,2-dione acylhydrolase (decyclizing) [Asanoa ferruginea]REF99927.1 3D-(3,5/4)-trihydroxycyclohexane-1,2-dione hydrolase [Asanoa ferruginea]GIF51610.1 3D-(3,5/4)-trihydroxycyclohexane-1,2-dione acylhydrolase (decyclizing) [Asanoa ferruginea]
MRLTVAQALVRFLAAQETERDGVRRRFFAGCFGIFGHGNLAGMGQALREYADTMPYHLARNEQAMVHTAAAYARMTNRLSAYACTTSVGPGATNMITGAAGATINRLPVLLLPGDTFATRVADPVLQQLELPYAGDVSVNDCLRPVSRYFDRINRPEQLVEAALRAMRVLTDPVETGAVTLALPQDVQAEAYDWPSEFLSPRVWHVPRAVPEPAALERAVAAIRGAERPLIVAGGGVIYAEATEALSSFASRTGIPVGETQAGKGALQHGHPSAVGAIGATGTTAANQLAAGADLVIGVGTRYSDFTTASRTLFANPGVRFVNLNVASFDAAKHSGLSLVADARAGLSALDAALGDWRVSEDYRAETLRLTAAWNDTVDRAYALDNQPLAAQSAVIGAVNEAAGERGVVVCAAGSMPGDLHKLWRPRDPKQYHVEYGYSCMGYEIAGGLGVKLAAPDRDVFVLVGDGSYLMMSSELVTAVAEGVKLIVVLVVNHGFASIGALSETVGVNRFGTWYRDRDGGNLPTDLAANAASLGADTVSVTDVDGLRAALAAAKESDRTTVIQIETDPLVSAPDSQAWWDVPVAEVAQTSGTEAARAEYEKAKRAQRNYL